MQQMRGDLVNLVQHLQSRGIQVWLEENTARHTQIGGFEIVSLEGIGKRVDMVIVLGGDGTMLSVARALMPHHVPLVGINRGRFGFLTDLRAEDMLLALDDILDGSFRRESRMLLHASVMRQGQELYQSIALNDVVIKSGLRLIELQVEIDGKFVHRQRSDGLIISTPTGTTAYSLSAGGPILHPGLEAIALVPISPHTLSNRPIAVSSAAKIEITVIQVDSSQISYDGQSQLVLEVGDRIQVSRAEQAITLLHPADYCYYEMLRNKLNWG